MSTTYDIREAILPPANVIHFREPRSLTLGTYVTLKYDMEIEYRGLTWYHVAGGFGGKNDRDDWVADVPGYSVSVTNYRGTGFARGNLGWGWNGDKTFHEEVDEVLKRARDGVYHRREEAYLKLSKLSHANDRVRAALETEVPE